MSTNPSVGKVFNIGLSVNEYSSNKFRLSYNVCNTGPYISTNSRSNQTAFLKKVDDDCSGFVVIASSVV